MKAAAITQDWCRSLSMQGIKTFAIMDEVLERSLEFKRNKAK